MRHRILTSTALICAAFAASACDSGNDAESPSQEPGAGLVDEEILDGEALEDVGAQGGAPGDGDAQPAGGPEEPPRPESTVHADGRPKIRPTDAFGVLREMKRLYPLVRERPAQRDLDRIVDSVVRREAAASQAETVKRWRADLTDIVTYGGEYSSALADGDTEKRADPEASYLVGMAHFLLADDQPEGDAKAHLAAATVALRTFLEQAPEGHALYAETEGRLAQAIALSSDGAEARAEAAAVLLERMQGTYEKVLVRPTVRNLHEIEDPFARRDASAENAKEQKLWRASVSALYEAANDYVRLFADAGVDARVMFWLGTAQLELAGLSEMSRARGLRRASLDSLRSYLSVAGDDAEHRAHAEYRMVDALLFTAADTPSNLAEAAELLPRVVPALEARSEFKEAMLVTHKVVKTLMETGRTNRTTEELVLVESLGETLDIQNRDFGPGTELLRALFNSAAIRPGAVMPEMPAGTATTDGAELTIASLRGKIAVVHFFKTDFSSKEKEVEDVLVPLHDAWKSSGLLELVGVSIDWEMPADFLTKQQANFEEWGRPLTDIHDGKQESVATWVAERGMSWRWTWDGKWLKNAVGNHYGVPMNRSWAVLLDAKGVIRWVGQPSVDLSRAALKLLEELD